MKKIKVLLALICFALIASMTPLTSHAADIEVDIKVAPNVINIDSPCPCVTVHTNIAYSIVVGDSVVLSVDESDDIYNYETFDDDRGQLVAKFHMTDVEAALPIEEPTGSKIFTLSGERSDGTSFSGEQIVKVVSISMDEKPGKQGKDVVDP